MKCIYDDLRLFYGIYAWDPNLQLLPPSDTAPSLLVYSVEENSQTPISVLHKLGWKNLHSFTSTVTDHTLIIMSNFDLPPQDADKGRPHFDYHSAVVYNDSNAFFGEAPYQPNKLGFPGCCGLDMVISDSPHITPRSLKATLVWSPYTFARHTKARKLLHVTKDKLLWFIAGSTKLAYIRASQ